MKNIKVIIFDIDDTLITHSTAINKAIKQFYNKFISSQDISFDNFQQLWKNAHVKYVDKYINGEITFSEQRILRLQEVFSGIDQNINEKEAEEYFDYYLKFYENSWELFYEVEDVLESLNKYKLGIVSDGDSEQQRQKLRDTGIIQYFDQIVISGDLGITKPDRRIFNEIINKLKIDYKEALYIGDNYEKDFLGAKKAGLNACQIDRNLKNPVHENDDIKIDNLNRISDLIEHQKIN